MCALSYERAQHTTQGGAPNEENNQVGRIIRSYKCGEWCASWGTIFKENFFMFMKDTREGFRKARHPAANGFQRAGEEAG